jgi:hypothetical protein
MSQQPYEWQDWSQVRFPPPYEEPSTASAPSRDLRSTSVADINVREYSKTSRPLIMRAKMWDDNGYYINGPTFQPWNHAKTQMDAIRAITASWNDPTRRAAVDTFQTYVSRYGHTNSPGVLWGIAQLGIDPESDVVKQILQSDADEVQRENRQSQPMRAGSPVANEDVEEAASLWEPLQFISRNAFSVLSSGMEAVQGSMRMIGGAVANDDMTAAERAGQILGATAGLFAGPLTGAIVAEGEDEPDNPFGNPWSQTDFGQTLALAREIGFDAFTSGQAGLDIRRADQELAELDPNFQNLTPDERTAMAEAYAQENEYYSQPGWFVDETSIVGERQRRRTFNTWAIPGPDNEMTAWTIGRGIASATVGADSEAYGTMSGAIDAVAAIVTDPLTYLPAVGLPSKALSAVTGGVWKIGKAGDEWRAVLRRMNEVGQEAQRLNAAGDQTAARQIAVEGLTEYLGRPPTAREVADVVDGIVFNVDPTDLKNMGIDEVAEMTRAAREVDLTSQQLDAAKPDTEAAYTYVRTARREILEGESTQRFIDSNVKSTGGTSQVAPLADIWDDFVAFGQQNPNVKPSDYMAQRFGLSPETGLPAENAADSYYQFLEVFDMYRTFAAGRKAPLSRSVDDFAVVLRDAASDTRSVKQAKDIDQTKLDSDAVALMVRPEADRQLEELESLNLHGVVVDGVPSADAGVLGAYGPDGGVFYFSGSARSKLNIADGQEVIPPKVREAVVNRLMQVAERDDMRLTEDIIDIDFDTIPGQVYRQISAATDARGFMNELFSDETLTYNGLLKAAALVGFDAVLDDIMRTAIKKNRIDGITNVDGVPGRTWLGNNPNVNGYGISPDVRESIGQVRGMPDPVTALDEIGIGARTTAPLGYRSLTPFDLDVQRIGKYESGMNNRDLLSQFRSDAIFNGYRRQEELKTQIDSLNAEWTDPVAKFKSVVGWHSGMRHHPVNGFTTDERGVRAFLFGMGPMSALGNRALGVLGDFVPQDARAAAIAARDKAATLGRNNPEYAPLMKEYTNLVDDAIGELILVTGSKWSADLYREVAENAINGGGKSGLIDILAPRLGVDISEGDISKTIVSRNKDGKTWLNSRRTVMPKVHRMLGQMPTARKVNLQDARDVVDNAILYGRYAGVDEKEIRSRIGAVMRTSGTVEEGLVARNALKEILDLSAVKMIENIEASGVTKVLFRGEAGQRRKKEIINAIKDSTALYIGGKYKARDGDINEAVALGADIRKFVTASGNEYIMPNPKLDAELADGFVGLPGVEEWGAGLRRITLALDRLPMVGNTADAALQFYNNFFRTSLLVFRGAYVIRNLAEMQVRMFLNGHESIFNSPATILAMTVGDEWWSRKVAKYATKREEAVTTLRAQLNRDPLDDEIEALAGPAPKMPSMLASFDKYKNTVLDTSFNTGMDAELAAANRVTDFWGLLRESHSLTDPRVYSSGIRQGWDAVEYGSQNFTKGWANELIMLQRSEVVRLVVGKPDQQQFASLTNGTAGMDVQKSIANDLMYSNKYEGLRRRLIAADEEYGRILQDEEAVLEYLFRNPNSIFNKVLLYTNNDPRLVNFIASGKLSYADGGVLSPNSFTDVRKRISAFRAVLDDHFSGDDWANHFRAANGGMGARVPFIETMDSGQGNALVNRFFEISAKIERLGAVGPEFRMAYWDRIADLAPSLRGKDVDRALKAAETTLGPIQNAVGKKIGRTHKAWGALNKSKENGTEGFMTLNELHEAAMKYAADEVAGLFYDAARRNNLWYALRVAIPFGQAWGNTLTQWTKLGAKRPLNIYKAQKLFNALQEEQSNAIYEAGQQFGPLSAYGKYEPGYAPWERDSQGGFFYTDDFGDTVFEVPFAGRALGMGANVLARMNGVDAGPLLEANASVQSPVTSLNLALGGDSVLPGFGPAVAFPLGADIVPDNKMTGWLRQQVAPFGDKQILESGTPAWLQKVVGGVQAIPVVGGVASSWTSSLYPAMKNRNINDAMAILSTTGNYPDLMTNPVTARRFKEDAEELAAATMLMTGMMQNVMPSTPLPEGAVRFPVGEGEEQTTAQYTLGLVNSLFQQYQVNNMGDRTAAVEEMIKDLGPYAAFALVGNWAGYTRLPTSQALDWAYDNPEIAAANIDLFTMFFPQGDSSDVRARRWLRDHTFGEQQRKNPDEAFAEAVGFLSGTQLARISSMENAGEMSADQAADARDAVRKQYLAVDDPAGTFLDRTMELEQINDFVNRYGEIQQSQAGKAFMIAWSLREKALLHTRAWTGDEDAGLGSEKATPVRNEYFRQLDTLIQQYPDFKILGNRLRKEWE